MKSPERPRERERMKKSGGGRKAKEVARDTLTFSGKSYSLFAAGFAAIVIGYIMLSRGSITVAPVLLVAGYCALIPLAILVK